MVISKRGVGVKRSATVASLEAVDYGLKLLIAFVDLVESYPPFELAEVLVDVTVARRTHRGESDPRHVLVPSRGPLRLNAQLTQRLDDRHRSSRR